MVTKKNHIFVVSNPISSIHASVLMAQLPKENSEFILLVDRGKRKDSFNAEIINCAGKNWTHIFNLGENIDDTSNLKPSARKRLTRKIKHVWPFRYFYNVLLKKYVSRYESQSIEKIKNVLHFVDSENSSVILYLLTQTVINKALVTVFPKANCNFFEHGLPDYLFSRKPQPFKTNAFYCLFNSAFAQFVKKHHLQGPEIKPLMSKEQYLHHCKAVFEKNEVVNHLSEKISNDSTLVIMQSLEKYELGNDFWLHYLSKIAIHEKQKNEICRLVLKPHPHQSNEVLHKLSEQLHKNGIENIILNEPKEIGFSSEVLFSTLYHKFSSVYSPFSYSLYFLSYLFNDTHIRFYDSFDAMKNHIGKAPKQYQEQFLMHEDIIKECFAVQTKSFTF